MDLTLTNFKGRINLAKEETNLQTRYLLSIPDPLSLGLETPGQNVIDRFVKNLVLAMNLYLERTALSVTRGGLSQPDIRFKRREGQVKVEERPKGKHITITETITLRDTIHVTMRIAEEINENEVMFALELINKLNGK